MGTTSKVRRVYSRPQRLEYLAQFDRSGLSATDFCQQAGIHLSTFSQWRRKSRPQAEPGFAEVRLSAGSASCPLTLHLPSGAKVEVSAPTEASWRGLGLLLKSLQSEFTRSR